jgi:hypothetical protein
MKDREFSKKFIALSDVWKEIEEFLHLLKQFRETMPARILKHLSGDLSPELAERITRAITVERESEDTIFQNLSLEGTAPEELARLGIFAVAKQTVKP